MRFVFQAIAIKNLNFTQAAFLSQSAIFKNSKQKLAELIL
jgi:hypothetical protein